MAGETARRPCSFRGYQYTRTLSEISGTMWISYSHEPWNATLPRFDEPRSSRAQRRRPLTSSRRNGRT